MSIYDVVDGDAIRSPIPDFVTELLSQFPNFDHRVCTPPEMRATWCDMANPKNKVGNQQRAFTMYWAVRCCTPLDLGLDLGSMRGITPFCIHVDRFGDGKPHPYYGGGPVWADVVGDMTNLSMFASNTFPFIAASHSLEHADVSRFVDTDRYPGWAGDGNATMRKAWIDRYSFRRDEYDRGAAMVVREEWLRVLRPNGLLAIVLPDQKHFDVLGCDLDHRHAWSSDDFRARILDRLVDVVDVLEYDTLKNNFSFNILLRKKMV
jgi:hypothetical protein